jgi:ParB-like chromosome segregation protein Spo0J
VERNVDGPAAETSVPLDALGQKLRALRLCRPNTDEHMRRSLQQRGQLTALTAFDNGGQLELVDGFKRLRAARRLGWTQLRVVVLASDVATATAAIVALHEHRGLCELEEGWVVRSLCREHGLSQGAVAQLMRRHKSWVSRRLLLVEALDEAVQADVRLGLLGARSALSVAALPRGNQQGAAQLVMSRGMSTRQAEALVRQLRVLDSDAARAHAIERWPEDGTTTAPSGRTRPRTAGEYLLADVAALMRLCVRIEVYLLQTPLGPDCPGVMRQTLSDLAALLCTLNAALGRALTPKGKAHAELA